MKKTYTIIAISKNTNSFGLREHLFLAPCGSGWRGLRSLYTPDGTRLRRGDSIEFDDYEGPAFRRGETWECCSRLADTPPALARAVVREAKREAEAAAS